MANIDYNKVFEWKKQFGDVYLINLLGNDKKDIPVIYKSLSFEEIDILQKIESESRREEDSCRMAILNDVNVDSLSPGAIRNLSSEITNKSTITDEDTLLQVAMENRNNVEKNFHKKLILMVCKVFPFYTPDILKKKNIYEILEIIAMAESLTGEKIIGVDSNDKIRDKLDVNETSPQGNKWTRTQHQNEEISMDTSSDSLTQEMEKEGHNYPKFKPKKPTTTGNKLVNQMTEMNQLLGTE